MGMLSNGGCDRCHSGKSVDEYYNSKQKKWVEEEVVCRSCLGTELDLTALGTELVEFLRETKGKI